MTRYTGTWHGQAEQDLADIWLSSSDREGITAAVEAIDLALATAAESKGNAIAEGLRALNSPPLRVLFVPRTHDCIAEVVFVRQI